MDTTCGGQRGCKRSYAIGSESGPRSCPAFPLLQSKAGQEIDGLFTVDVLADGAQPLRLTNDPLNARFHGIVHSSLKVTQYVCKLTAPDGEEEYLSPFAAIGADRRACSVSVYSEVRLEGM